MKYKEEVRRIRKDEPMKVAEAVVKTAMRRPETTTTDFLLAAEQAFAALVAIHDIKVASCGDNPYVAAGVLLGMLTVMEWSDVELTAHNKQILYDAVQVANEIVAKSPRMQEILRQAAAEPESAVRH